MTVNGITGISLPTLEKRFQLTSKDLGIISASNDISAILLICFVSFYGQFGNKIKWIGCGAIITGERRIVKFKKRYILTRQKMATPCFEPRRSLRQLWESYFVSRLLLEWFGIKFILRFLPWALSKTNYDRRLPIFSTIFKIETTDEWKGVTLIRGNKKKLYI